MSMTGPRWARLLVPLTSLAAMPVLTGCGSDDGDCSKTLSCDPGSTSSGGGSGGSGAGGGSGGNPACAADPKDDPSVVRDECGVFASATAPAGGTGTMQSPLAKLVDAVASAAESGKNRVYLCASETFVESIEL